MLTVILSALAALGALTLVWLTLGALLCPAGWAAPVLVTLPLHGEAEGLEQTLRALRWLRGTGLLEAELLLRDEGLSAGGRERVRLLMHDYEL